MSPLPRFRLHRPRTIAAALDLLHRHGPDAKVLAGGTDLVVNLRHGLHAPGHIVSLHALAELAGVQRDEAGVLSIGAMTRVSRLAADEALHRDYPVLAQAAGTVAGPTLRSMATVGGNLCLDTRCHWYNQSFAWRRTCGFCLKKDGTVCHVAPRSDICRAVHSGDLAPALLALEAHVVLRSRRGERRLALRDFYLEDGTKTCVLEAGEILTRVTVPPQRAGLAGCYRKLRSRGSIDYPLCGVAIGGRVTPDRTYRAVLVALTAVGPRPFVVPGVTEALEGVSVDDTTSRAKAVDLVLQAANPLHTGGAFSPAYRRLRLGLFARDGLETLGNSSVGSS